VKLRPLPGAFSYSWMPSGPWPVKLWHYLKFRYDCWYLRQYVSYVRWLNGRTK
jgi:hypothetical protein